MVQSEPLDGLPGPLLQQINAALHREPIASIAYGCFWSLFLMFTTPLAVLVLHVQILYRLLFGRVGANTYDPQSNPDYDMAVVITGCDSGFGKELAIWATEAGYTVFAGCLDANKCKDLAELPGSERLVVVQMDVTSDEQVTAAAKTVEEWLQHNMSAVGLLHSEEQKKKKKRVLHALVNNAGVGRGGYIDWTRDLAIEKYCMDVNYLGMVRCCRAFLSILKRQAINKTFLDMRIINLTSMAGLVSSGVGLSAYMSSKHAATAFSQVLRHELRHTFGIQVTTITPSFHGTPLTDSMNEMFMRIWQDMESDLQSEYGETFREQALRAVVELPRRSTWNAIVVLEQVMKCLKMKSIPPNVLIGMDAQFGLPILRMVPGWCQDVAVGIVSPGAPAVMMKVDPETKQHFHGPWESM
jgi:NAD(P)-dependent dehydrogenase (short-subunit alcohol dehydrogenase family)